MEATGGHFYSLLLRAKGVVNLIIQNSHVGFQDCGSVRVESPARDQQKEKHSSLSSLSLHHCIYVLNLLLCLLLNFQALDAVQISTGSGESLVIEGPDIICDLGQGPLLLLLSLPGQTEAFSACTTEESKVTTFCQENII